MLDLTISIVNHSNPELLRDCLQSIFENTHHISFDVVVVDNATDQRLVPEMKSEFAAVRWIMNSRRMGFSANHNQMLRACNSRYACILNDDMVIHAGAFRSLIEYMDAHPEVGMAGPRLLNPDGSIQATTFRELSLMNELIGIVQLPGFLQHLKRRRENPAHYFDDTSFVDWILGACIVVRHETLVQIGPLDDLTFPIANNEEIDWCRRARSAGWKIAHVPNATMLHYGGQSMDRNVGQAGPDKMLVEMLRTRIAYFRKHYGLISALLLRLIYVITLPWNTAMLAQSYVRKTMPRTWIIGHWRSLLSVARMALLP